MCAILLFKRLRVRLIAMVGTWMAPQLYCGEGPRRGCCKVPDGSIGPPIRPITRGFGARSEGTKFADKTANVRRSRCIPGKMRAFFQPSATEARRRLILFISLIRLIIPCVRRFPQFDPNRNLISQTDSCNRLL